MRVDAILVLGPQLVGQRVDLFPRVHLERLDAHLHVFPELIRLLDQSLFQAREPAIQLPKLAAEQEVADLVDAPAAGCFPRRRTGATFQVAADLGCYSALFVFRWNHGIAPRD